MTRVIVFSRCEVGLILVFLIALAVVAVLLRCGTRPPTTPGGKEQKP
jgi:hypothetical protein